MEEIQKIMRCVKISFKMWIISKSSVGDIPNYHQLYTTYSESSSRNTHSDQKMQHSLRPGEPQLHTADKLVTYHLSHSYMVPGSKTLGIWLSCLASQIYLTAKLQTVSNWKQNENTRKYFLQSLSKTEGDNTSFKTVPEISSMQQWGH